MLSRVYAGRQQYVDSENAIKQAVKLDKNNIWYQVALAKSYMTTENYKSALPLWEKICKAMPDNTEYLTDLAVCYEKTGASDKASAVRDRLGRLAPLANDDQQISENKAVTSGESGYKAQGMNSLQAQQYDQAVTQLEMALREDDTDFDLWNAFAEAVSKSGQWRKLTEKEEDLTTLFPQSSALLYSLATAFLHIPQPEKAVEYYQQALAFAFDPVQIQNIKRGLYEAYTALGDEGNANRYR